MGCAGLTDKPIIINRADNLAAWPIGNGPKGPGGPERPPQPRDGAGNKTPRPSTMSTTYMNGHAIDQLKKEKLMLETAGVHSIKI